MLLKGCLNGARRPAEHPALPVTPAALAADAARVVAVGVGALHAHPKDRAGAGADTLVGDEVAAVLKAVRAAAPTVAVGITTGAWTIEDPAERVKAIRAWTVLPDFASVNWHEPGAEDVAEVLLERGVGVGAGLWHAQAAREWGDLGVPEPLLPRLDRARGRSRRGRHQDRSRPAARDCQVCRPHDAGARARGGHELLAGTAVRRPPPPAGTDRVGGRPAPP